MINQWAPVAIGATPWRQRGGAPGAGHVGDSPHDRRRHARRRARRPADCGRCHSICTPALPSPMTEASPVARPRPVPQHHAALSTPRMIPVSPPEVSKPSWLRSPPHGPVPATEFNRRELEAPVFRPRFRRRTRAASPARAADAVLEKGRRRADEPCSSGAWCPTKGRGRVIRSLSTTLRTRTTGSFVGGTTVPLQQRAALHRRARWMPTGSCSPPVPDCELAAYYRRSSCAHLDDSTRVLRACWRRWRRSADPPTSTAIPTRCSAGAAAPKDFEHAADCSACAPSTTACGPP